MNMEEIVGFLQIELEQDFGMEDDACIEHLQVCIEELRKAKMDLPPKGTVSEFPQKPFGLWMPPSLEMILGRRSYEPSQKELANGIKKTREARRQQRSVSDEPRDRTGNAGSSRGNSPDMDQISYDTITNPSTGGVSSHASYQDMFNSQTSYMDNDAASTATSISRYQSRLGENGFSDFDDSRHASQLSMNEAGAQSMSYSGAVPLRTSPSNSDYDNINSAQSSGGSGVYERELERTLEAIETASGSTITYTPNNISVVKINGFEDQEMRAADASFHREQLVGVEYRKQETFTEHRQTTTTTKMTTSSHQEFHQQQYSLPQSPMEEDIPGSPTDYNNRTLTRSGRLTVYEPPREDLVVEPSRFITPLDLPSDHLHSPERTPQHHSPNGGQTSPAETNGHRNRSQVDPTTPVNGFTHLYTHSPDRPRPIPRSESGLSKKSQKSNKSPILEGNPIYL